MSNEQLDRIEDKIDKLHARFNKIWTLILVSVILITIKTLSGPFTVIDNAPSEEARVSETVRIGDKTD